MGNRNNVRAILNAARYNPDAWDDDMEDEMDDAPVRHVNRPTYNRPDDWN